MKNIKKIIFLSCALLLSTATVMDLNADEEEINIVTNLLRFNQEPEKVYEYITNYFIEKWEVDEWDLPKLKNAMVIYDTEITLAIEHFKMLPTDARKTIYNASCGAKAAIIKLKKKLINNIKTYKNFISEYEKKERKRETLENKNNKSIHDEKLLENLTRELKQQETEYKIYIKSLKEAEEKYKNMNFTTLEEWINKIKSVAYWNSGSGFFEQFWNLNWSGKLLTFMGTPLACYGAYKIYNEYMATTEDDDLEGVQDTPKNLNNNIKILQVETKQKAR